MPCAGPRTSATTTFEEVALGYTEEHGRRRGAAAACTARTSPASPAARSTSTSPSSSQRSPRGISRAPIEVISADLALPAVCGRVCPQETQCESKCVRGIKGEPVGIGRLERFVADWHNANVQREPVNARVQRPQGRRHRLRPCRPDLRGRPGASMGYEVTVFEALAHRRRRAGLRHPGVPSAQGHRAEGGRQPQGAGRGDRDRTWSSARSLTIDELFEHGLSRPCSSAPARACPASWTSPARASRAFTPPTSS